MTEMDKAGQQSRELYTAEVKMKTAMYYKPVRENKDAQNRYK
jgi:hypothetical protein